jgi:hypothetical protein
MMTLDDAAVLASGEQRLAVVSTLRADATIHSSCSSAERAAAVQRELSNIY